MAFQPYPLPYPAQKQGTNLGVNNGTTTFSVSPASTPAAFAGVTVQTGYILYDYGCCAVQDSISSLAFNFYGQTQGVTESAVATFSGVTAYPTVAPSTIVIPYGCVCTSMTVYTTTGLPFQPYICGIGLAWTGLNGAQYSQSVGVAGNFTTYTYDIQTLTGATVVPIGFFWFGFTAETYPGGYYPTNLGLTVGSYPISVSYGSLTSTGDVTTSLVANQTCGTSETATNTTSVAQTTTLTASYSVSTTQTVSDQNTVGTSSTASVGSSTSFSQNIVVANASTGVTTTNSVTATVSSSTTLTQSSTTTVTESTTLQTTVSPDSSVEMVITGDYLTSPITFSGSGPATYTWYTFDGGETTQEIDATVTFSDYQTTFGFASSVVPVD